MRFQLTNLKPEQNARVTGTTCLGGNLTSGPPRLTWREEVKNQTLCNVDMMTPLVLRPDRWPFSNGAVLSSFSMSSCLWLEAGSVRVSVSYREGHCHSGQTSQALSLH